eukprot:CAMPEP_0117493450 /NCGR_PEP_ID=MMETSP0784-20121206/19103_1 /TAXON_ID=39447 /ORGANISM="" /LENGTH=484 /DNA_ID=CAMNT_0005288301 /DNA_START=97 /DNA_END=1551 /DNA_ORIENTATION=+
MADWNRPTPELKLKKVRTSELMVCGVSLGISGLFLSLIITIYSANCDASFRKPTYVYHRGGELCKSAVHTKVVLEYWTRENGLVVDIPGATCHSEDDCKKYRGSLCIGGPHGRTVEGYCKSHECTCKNVVFDCGVRHKFDFTFTPGDILKDCKRRPEEKTDACKANQTLQIAFWKDPGYTRSLATLGCERYEKTSVSSALKFVEKHLQSMGHLTELKDEDDQVWKPMVDMLATTLDLDFNAFWPSTISESVAQASSPASKIFLGFMLLASLCLLMSGYTHTCKTVLLSGVKVPIFGLQVDTLRQLLPPVGLILLAVVPMKPTSYIYNLPDVLMTLVHLSGAQFCFVAFLICEACCLLDRRNREEMHGVELVLRTFITAVGCVAMFLFALFYGILMVFSGSEASPYVAPPFSGFSDMYVKEVEAHQSFLVRPAEGMWKGIKVLSYSAEFIVALSLLGDLFVVWFFFSRQLNSTDNDDARLLAAES